MFWQTYQAEMCLIEDKWTSRKHNVIRNEMSTNAIIAFYLTITTGIKILKEFVLEL